MREILFRGKRVAGGKEWIYGNVNYYPNINRWFIRLHPAMNVMQTLEDEVSAKTVGQFTGLLDKNGKKIFEGDIVKHRSYYSGNFIISVVTYTEGYFLAMADNNSGFNLSDKLEVIGNIHDNPELLKGGE